MRGEYKVVVATKAFIEGDSDSSCTGTFPTRLKAMLRSSEVRGSDVRGSDPRHVQRLAKVAAIENRRT